MQTCSPPSLPRWGAMPRAAVAAHGPRFLKLLNGLGNELLNIGLSLPYAFLRETCCEARLQVGPVGLPHDLGKV